MTVLSTNGRSELVKTKFASDGSLVSKVIYRVQIKTQFICLVRVNTSKYDFLVAGDTKVNIFLFDNQYDGGDSTMNF